MSARCAGILLGCCIALMCNSETSESRGIGRVWTDQTELSGSLFSENVSVADGAVNVEAERRICLDALNLSLREQARCLDRECEFLARMDDHPGAISRSFIRGEIPDNGIGIGQDRAIDFKIVGGRLPGVLDRKGECRQYSSIDIDGAAARDTYLDVSPQPNPRFILDRLNMASGALPEFAGRDPQTNGRACQDQGRDIDQRYIKKSPSFRALIVGAIAFSVGLVGTLAICARR